MWIQLRPTALNSDRFGVSDRGIAVVVMNVKNNISKSWLRTLITIS